MYTQTVQIKPIVDVAQASSSREAQAWAQRLEADGVTATTKGKRIQLPNQQYEHARAYLEREHAPVVMAPDPEDQNTTSINWMGLAIIGLALLGSLVMFALLGWLFTPWY